MSSSCCLRSLRGFRLRVREALRANISHVHVPHEQQEHQARDDMRRPPAERVPPDTYREGTSATRAAAAALP
eukprot:scaffold5286_cov224-Pinguiococcus_pyrenoidosus.AAC.4